MRGVILPVAEMKSAITECHKQYFKKYTEECARKNEKATSSGSSILACEKGEEEKRPVLDFGSGTLFWSEWFQETFDTKVLAFDIAYKNRKILEKLNNKNENISCSYDFDDIKNKKFDTIFACDVLHHVGYKGLFGVLEDFSKMSNFIVIKDIEANDKIGNLQNKIHDFLINREIVCDIYSSELVKFFEDKGFQVHCSLHKKLGYPHFLLIAFKPC